MEIEFVEPASIELDDAIQYYNLQASKLGDKFLDEVISATKLIARFPNTWKRNTTHTRCALLKKFPYNLIYTIFREKIYIIAVAHQHRKPEYWIDRILK